MIQPSSEDHDATGDQSTIESSEMSRSHLESSTSAYTVDSQYEFLKGKTERNSYTEYEMAKTGQDCGIGRLRPKFMQRCADIRMFIFVICLLLTVSTGLSSGYLNSVITTIEKRFEIGSSTSGLIAASYEFGSLVAVIFVSYLGGRRHIPIWIGCGVVLMGVGAFIFTLPHIIAEKYTLQSQALTRSYNKTGNVCRRSDAEVNDEEIDPLCVGEHAGSWSYILMLIVAQVLIGTGNTPILTLGTTYVDNHVPKSQSPAYLAFIYGTGALGPVIGFALGALLLQYYVDYFYFEVNLVPSDPRWVGAWWGGFFICGFMLLSLAVPFFAFPKRLRIKKSHQTKFDEELLGSDTSPEPEYGKAIKDIPRSALSLLKNSVYMITSLGVCCEVSIVSCFIVFLPKYLETQFGISKSRANLFTGGIGIPGAVIGIFIGSYILKRFQLKPKGAIQLTLLLHMIAIAGFTFFFYLGCDNLNIAGATQPYVQNSSHTNLTASCNIGCDCSSDYLEPVCGINGVTYFSPCHAGCTHFFQVNSELKHIRQLNYTGCSCISDEQTISQNYTGCSCISDEQTISQASSGPCKSTCNRLVPFLMLLVVMTFCVAGTQMPLLMVTLRCVKEEEKSFALGMQFVLLRLLAFIPSPIIFGNIIDTTCLLWKKQCGKNGACLIYDIVHFRYKYVGSSMALKCLGALLFSVVWLLLQRRDKMGSQQFHQIFCVNDTTLHASVTFKTQASSSRTLQNSRSICADSLNSDLETISTWGAENRVTFNDSKTQTLTISRKRDSSLPALTIGNATLTDSPLIHTLGVDICPDLSWSTHINNIAKKAAQKIGYLFRARLKSVRRWSTAAMSGEEPRPPHSTY